MRTYVIRVWVPRHAHAFAQTELKKVRLFSGIKLAGPSLLDRWATVDRRVRGHLFSPKLANHFAAFQAPKGWGSPPVWYAEVLLFFEVKLDGQVCKKVFVRWLGALPDDAEVQMQDTSEDEEAEEVIAPLRCTRCRCTRCRCTGACIACAAPSFESRSQSTHSSLQRMRCLGVPQDDEEQEEHDDAPEDEAWSEDEEDAGEACWGDDDEQEGDGEEGNADDEGEGEDGDEEDEDEQEEEVDEEVDEEDDGEEGSGGNEEGAGATSDCASACGSDGDGDGNSEEESDTDDVRARMSTRASPAPNCRSGNMWSLKPPCLTFLKPL